MSIWKKNLNAVAVKYTRPAVCNNYNILRKQIKNIRKQQIIIPPNLCPNSTYQYYRIQDFVQGRSNHFFLLDHCIWYTPTALPPQDSWFHHISKVSSIAGIFFWKSEIFFEGFCLEGRYWIFYCTAVYLILILNLPFS